MKISIYKKTHFGHFPYFLYFFKIKNLPVTFFQENSLNLEIMINAFFTIPDIMIFR